MVTNSPFTTYVKS